MELNLTKGCFWYEKIYGCSECKYSTEEETASEKDFLDTFFPPPLHPVRREESEAPLMSTTQDVLSGPSGVAEGLRKVTP